MSYFSCYLPEDEMKSALTYLSKIGCILTQNAVSYLKFDKRSFDTMIIPTKRHDWDIGMDSKDACFIFSKITFDRLVERFSDLATK